MKPMNQGHGFEEFLAIREELISCISQIAATLNGIGGGAERAKQLTISQETLREDAFRLMVVGEFKRGKSTLINALLGKDVLPARVAPCTAIITEVRYAEQPRAVLHFNDTDKGSIAVNVDKLRDYVTIDQDASDDDDASSQVSKSPYSKMELHYPLPLCKNNVILVDSPGLNEHKTRTTVALDFLSKADALVLVLSCRQQFSQSEQRFVDVDLGGRNLRNVFFVWNHFDEIVDSHDDIADIKKLSKQRLESRAGSNARIFYVSARDALLGKKHGDDAKLDRSGLMRFEAALERFLATERGRVKLLTPLQMAEAALREAVTELIPYSESLLLQPLEQLTKAYEEQRPKLVEIENQRDRLLRSVERRRDNLIREATSSYEQFVNDIELRIPQELGSFEIGKWETLFKKGATEEKVAQHLQDWFAERCKKWQEEELASIFKSHTQDLEDAIERQTEDFEAKLKNLRQAFVTSITTGDSEQDDISITNRLFSAVGGLLLAGPGSALEGAAMGVKGMAKGLAVNILVGVGLLVTGVGLPVVLPVLISVGLVRTLMGGASARDKLRDKVSKKLIAELRKNVPETKARITSQINEAFEKLHSSLAVSLRIAIDEIAGQVQAVLKQKQEGEAQMKLEKQRLADARKTFVTVSKRLVALRNEVDALVEET
ncbi:MAG: dynamin family protein [Myxococcales bacterium]|jgi:tRNA U34 5-carboxymethylaminomethyl modifying GTPase MnmE/TrmE|nr:dynamin family protein [Myxococcales bacterium]